MSDGKQIESVEADEFLDIVAANPSTFADFVGMPNTPETRQKLFDFIKKKHRELMADWAGVQPLSGPTGLILTIRAKYSDDYKA